MARLVDFVGLYTQRLALEHYATYLELATRPYDMGGPEVRAFLQHLSQLTHTIFVLFPAAFEPFFKGLLKNYGYQTSGHWEDAWDDALHSHAPLLALAAEIRRLLAEASVDDRAIVQLLYQRLIKQDPHSVVSKARMFSKTFDAVLIRGATQYGKTREALLLAWRAWFEGVRIGDDSVGRCVTFLFVRNVGGNDSKRQFASAIETLNSEIERLILGQYPLLTAAQLDRFKLKYRDTYDATLDSCQVVAKLCNRWQLDKASERELPQLAVASAADGTQPATLRSYLIFDEDDVNMQGENKEGEQYRTEEGRCRLLQGIRCTFMAEEGDEGTATTSAVFTAMGWASITATPEGLCVAKACQQVSYQKLDLLEDAQIRDTYYGYDRRIPRERRPIWTSVPPDWDAVQGSRGTTQQRERTAAGLTTFLDTIKASERHRRALVFATLKPRVVASAANPASCASATALEETQRMIAGRFAEDARGVLALTYCGGPSNQPRDQGQQRYRCKLVASERIATAVLQWFNDAGDACSCERCGLCVKRLHSARIIVDHDEGCVKFTHKDVGASDLVTMLATCATHLVDSGLQRRPPHIITVTGEMGCRSVSWRSRDGTFYLTDLYVAYVPDRISSNNSVFVKQLLGRICMTARYTDSDGRSRTWRPNEVATLRIWCSKEVETNMRHLVDNGDAVWKNWRDGGPPSSTPLQALDSLKLTPTAGRKRDGIHVTSDKVEKHFRLAGQPTRRGTYLSFCEALYYDMATVRAKLSGQDLQPYGWHHPAFLTCVRPSDISALAPFRSAAMRHHTVQLLSALHYIKLPLGVGADNEAAIESWLQGNSRFQRRATLQCNDNKGRESFLGYEPSNPGARPEFWPDLWYQTGPEPGMITVIEHTMGWEEAHQLPQQACIIRLFHRFWNWHTEHLPDKDRLFVDLLMKQEMLEPEPAEATRKDKVNVVLRA